MREKIRELSLGDTYCKPRSEAGAFPNFHRRGATISTIFVKNSLSSAIRTRIVFSTVECFTSSYAIYFFILEVCFHFFIFSQFCYGAMEKRTVDFIFLITPTQILPYWLNWKMFNFQSLKLNQKLIFLFFFFVHILYMYIV